MCALDGGMSVPDFGHGVTRERLTRLMTSHGDKPVVIFGPSGAGKSFLAAQFVQISGSPVCWLCADGVALGAAETCDLLLRALGLEAPDGMVGRGAAAPLGDHVADLAEAVKALDRGEGVCVVLDDFGTSSDGDGLQFLHQAGMALWRAGSRMVVTTRAIDGWSPDARCDWQLVDGHDLALRPAEAEEFATLLGVGLASEDIKELCEVTSGHAALFSAMAIQASRYGLDWTGSRANTLDAWLDRVLQDLSADEVVALRLATSLKEGTERDLRRLGVVDPRRALQRIGETLPLVQVRKATEDGLGFRVHDLVDGYLVETGRGLAPCDYPAVLRLLTAHEDFSRACDLLVRAADEDLARSWLVAHGDQAFMKGNVSALSRLLHSVSTSALMSEAATLVLWSRVCYETGRYEESLSKAKAARLLAEHERDNQVVRSAIAQTLAALRYLGRQDEADALAGEIADAKADYVDNMLLAEALFCIGYGRVWSGDLAAAEAPFEAVLDLSTGKSECRHIARLAQNSLAILPAITRGDFQESRARLSKLLDDPADSPSTRVMIRGNLAQCLVETGRCQRAESVARSVVKETELYGLHVYAGAYLPILGSAREATGDVDGGVSDIRRGIAVSFAGGDVTDAAVNQVCLSQVLRASGHIEEALTEAEQSLDALSERDVMGFRRLAAFEVAACLLAGGDGDAARNWVGSALEIGETENPFHLIRSAMILSECDRREGSLESALERLRPFASYVRSENPNLQVALYCRSFPSLGGLFALALGPGTLPVHMLRMIPPESAETILSETRTWLDDATWRALGARLLGDEEFARFLARDGLPVCHVHFFGGLEVSIGGRAVREKDWRKRKARLLFAMLVLRRGQDVPRDQLFEYLFPEMDPERAKNNLYVIWSTMKSVLMGEGGKGVAFPYFEAVGGVCRSVRDNIRCDVDDFDRLLSKAREHETEGQLSEALAYYERLSSLYRGDLLPGDVYDDWFADLRERYRITFVDAMLTAGEILMNADDPGNALVFVRRAIQTDPLREDLYQIALRCQISAGQRSGAIDTYLQCRSKLAEDLGLDPSAETRALYDKILAMEDRPRIVPLDPLID